MANQKVELTLEEVNAILGYLGTKPYQEVYQLVGLLQSKVQPELPKEKKKK